MADDGSESSEDEKPPRNTVGNVPLEWYKQEEHIGYDRCLPVREHKAISQVQVPTQMQVRSKASALSAHAGKGRNSSVGESLATC